MFQHTAARRRLGSTTFNLPDLRGVSTHSRPKAAGRTAGRGSAVRLCFNTQPPEGGWSLFKPMPCVSLGFNTQPPEGGWVRVAMANFLIPFEVSTHSRPKAAGVAAAKNQVAKWFQHTAARRRLGRPDRRTESGSEFQHTAARRRLVIHDEYEGSIELVSTHSRPKAAGASLKSLAPSGFAAPISLGSQEKRERKYNTAFSVTPAFAIS